MLKLSFQGNSECLLKVTQSVMEMEKSTAAPLKFTIVLQAES